MTRAAAMALCALTMAGCSGGNDGTSELSGLAAQPVQSAQAEGQVSGIHALIAAQSTAWAAKDAAAYAATYAEDVEIVNPVGGINLGRAAVQGTHAFLFHPVTGFFRESTSVWSIRGIEFITGTSALVTLDVTLSGVSGLPPGLPSVEPGVVRTRWVWLAVKNGPRWEIAFQQMTPIPAS